MRYDYDADIEAFVRSDKKGNKLWFNMYEAQRIMTLYQLGYTPNKIATKMEFKSNKVAMSSVKTFIDNVNNGNIVIDNDAPAPVEYVNDMSLEARVSKLEQDFDEFRKKFVDPTPDDGISEKVRKWLMK